MLKVGGDNFHPKKELTSPLRDMLILMRPCGQVMFEHDLLTTLRVKHIHKEPVSLVCVCVCVCLVDFSRVFKAGQPAGVVDTFEQIMTKQCPGQSVLSRTSEDSSQLTKQGNI